MSTDQQRAQCKHGFSPADWPCAECCADRAEKAEARVAELVDIATRAVNAYDGAHSTTCHVFECGLDDDDIADEIANGNMSGCTCGATETRDDLRAAIGPRATPSVSNGHKDP